MNTLIELVNTRVRLIFGRILYKLMTTIDRLTFLSHPIQIALAIVWVIFYCATMALALVIVVAIFIMLLLKLIMLTYAR